MESSHEDPHQPEPPAKKLVTQLVTWRRKSAELRGSQRSSGRDDTFRKTHKYQGFSAFLEAERGRNTGQPSVRSYIRDHTAASRVFEAFLRVRMRGQNAFSFRFGTRRQDSAQDSGSKSSVDAVVCPLTRLTAAECSEHDALMLGGTPMTDRPLADRQSPTRRERLPAMDATP